MKPGDVYLINDPYDGGTHLADVTVVKPIYYQDEVLFMAIIEEAVCDGTPSTWATMRGAQSQMAHEKSCTSAKMGEREVRIIVMPISLLIVPRRWKTMDMVMGSTVALLMP
jgi:N-methylhydantoinase B/oxoprolinase/acetone carboxylase alpha subunit